MTVHEHNQFISLLTLWLKNRKREDYISLINFLDCDKDLQALYKGCSESEFYKVLSLFDSEKLDFEIFIRYFLSSQYHKRPDLFIRLIPVCEYVLNNHKDISLSQGKNLKRVITENEYRLLLYPESTYYNSLIKAGEFVYQSYYCFKKDILPQIQVVKSNNQQISNNGLENVFSKNKGFYIGGGWHYDGDGHLLTVGGSGAGKGVNFIIPALLSPALVASGSSVVVLDPKGENLAICGEHFKRNGYKVISINPFDIPEIKGFGSARFNPFSLTSKADIEAPTFCDLIAECLIPDNGKNEHWDESARQYISLYLLYMVANDQASFKNLFEAVRMGGAKRLDYLYEMSQCQAFGGIISATAAGIYSQLEYSTDPKEIDGIFSNVRRGTDLFKNPQLSQHLTFSDFNLTNLAKEKTALFVCVNPAQLQLFSGWLRVFFGCVFRTLQKHYNPQRRVLLLLDEFPQIGRLREFEMSVAYMRGYNVTLWPIVQDLSQLKRLYWDSWQSFVGSAAVKMWLPLGADNFTIDYLENRLPINDELDFKGGKVERQSKKLLTKFELISLPHALIEARGLDSFAQFEKMPYWSLPWSKNASPNPFRR